MVMLKVKKIAAFLPQYLLSTSFWLHLLLLFLLQALARVWVWVVALIGHLSSRY